MKIRKLFLRIMNCIAVLSAIALIGYWTYLYNNEPETDIGIGILYYVSWIMILVPTVAIFWRNLICLIFGKNREIPEMIVRILFLLCSLIILMYFFDMNGWFGGNIYDYINSKIDIVMLFIVLIILYFLFSVVILSFAYVKRHKTKKDADLKF